VTERNGRIHTQVAELLSAYIDDQVSAEERVRVEAHLATCSECDHDLATLRQTVALVGQLPQVAAPRPFTLREADVKTMRPSRPAWWGLPWTRGLVGAGALLLCVVIVGGVLLLGRPGMLGEPGAPVAMEAPSASQATAEAQVPEKMVVKEAEEAVEERVVEAEKEAQPAAGAPPPAPVGEEATAEFGMLEEAPAEPPPPEGEAATDEVEKAAPTQGHRAVASATPVPMPSPTPAPALAAEVAASPTPVLVEVQDLHLEIEPGVIRVSGRLPLPEGQELRVELWKEGQLTEWVMPEEQVAVLQADGRFSLELQAQPETDDFDLFGIEPAQYELRIRAVDLAEATEARIPFDTYAPPPAPTSDSP
jgi:anti-sigma factor RsiW